MKKWLILLWFAICVVGSTSFVRADDLAPTKQTSKTIKIESLTVQRLLKGGLRISEQSTFEKNIKYAIIAERLIRDNNITSDKMIIAMLANAWHESKWNPKAQGGSCIGLFQVHLRHLGKGSTRAQLFDPAYNTKKIMTDYKFKTWVNWCKKNSDATAGKMAYKFADLVERCLNQHKPPRSVTANRWYKHLKTA